MIDEEKPLNFEDDDEPLDFEDEEFIDDKKEDEMYNSILCTRQISQNPYPIRVLPS
ncbi:hypothetical protein L1X32_19925 [Acinetobacter baumannii]|nr:hypothetical protein [Acinetobacter baumannii]MCF4365958.1 hypothetical protein [Acinetobacter baumannii]